MSAFSDYLEQAVLNAVLRGVAFPAPSATTYVALFTSDPLDDGSGTELTNITAPGYARVGVAAAGGWTAPEVSTPATGSTVSNVAAVEFPEAVGDWAGPITHFALFDSAANGNMLFRGQLSTPRTIATGDVLRFSVGALVVGVN